MLPQLLNNMLKDVQKHCVDLSQEGFSDDCGNPFLGCFLLQPDSVRGGGQKWGEMRSRLSADCVPRFPLFTMMGGLENNHGISEVSRPQGFLVVDLPSLAEGSQLPVGKERLGYYPAVLSQER